MGRRQRRNRKNNNEETKQDPSQRNHQDNNKPRELKKQQLREEYTELALRPPNNSQIILVAEADSEELAYSYYNLTTFEKYGLSEEDFKLLVNTLNEGMKKYQEEMNRAKKYLKFSLLSLILFPSCFYVSHVINESFRRFIVFLVLLN